MAHERLRPEYFFDQERIEQLKQLAPECFEDGKINFKTLRQNLGDWRQDEEDPELEHFGLFWPGKRDARRAAAIPPEGTLEPVWGEGLKADGTPDTDGVNDSKNIFIEGENLEVLKILQKSYAGKIKMIYIDPPYNTGNDFVYDDDFTEPLHEYLRRTGQMDEEGKPMTTNKRSDGRFHSRWLSMMYPRLRLARNLLRDDGLIFVSIDDNEVDKLIMIMNEIFGEENKEGVISWRRRHNQPNDKTKVIAKVAEYILVYSKNSDELRLKGTYYGIPLSDSRIKDYKNPDNDPEGEWSSNPWKAAQGRGGTRYVITTPTGKKYNEVWYGNEDTFTELLRNERVHWTDKGNGVPRIKIYLKEALRNGQSAINFFTHESFGSNQEASAELAELFDGNKLFDNPKPIRLLKVFLNIALDENSIVLDFFAGSGSLGHALFEYESSSPSGCKFILVQLPEIITADTDSGKNALRLGFNNICEITRSRLKLASKKVKEFNVNEKLDMGFKAYTLKQSNYRSWSNLMDKSIHEIENQLSLFIDNPLRDDYTKSGLMSELLLLEGFSLSSKIMRLPMSSSYNDIYRVFSDQFDNSLLICLDNNIEKETIASLSLQTTDIFICLDSAISSEDKLRLSDKGLIKTI